MEKGRGMGEGQCAKGKISGFAPQILHGLHFSHHRCHPGSDGWGTGR